MDSHLTVLFDKKIPTVQRLRILTQFPNPILRARDEEAEYDITIPDGTQWHWSSIYAALPGVTGVNYSRDHRKMIN